MAVGVLALFGLGFLTARGCENDGPIVQKDVELQAEVARYRFLAEDAENRRAQAAEARHAAERKAEALKAENAALVKKVRSRPKPSTLEDAVRQLETCLEVVEKKTQRIDLVQAALDASKTETSLALEAEENINRALVASEKRADMWRKRAVQDRRKKIAIGIGAALGGAALTLGATAAAGRL